MAVILIQVTDKCNLKCVECYTEGRKEYKDDINVLSVLCAVRRIIEDVKVEYVCVIGREPFLLDVEKMEMLINGLHKFGLKNITVQTNATCVSDNIDMVRLFRKNKVLVGVSYRGYKELFDKLAGVEGAYDMFVEGVDILKKYNVYGGALFFAPLSYSKEIFDNRERIYRNIIELNLENIKFNETWGKGKFEGYGDFVIDCQKYMIENDCYVEISPIVNIVRGIFSVSKFDMCNWKVKCPSIIKVYSDGNIGFCESKDIKFSMFYPECLKCPIYGLCEGGCCRIRSVNNGKNPYCEDRIKIVKYIYENISLLGEYYGCLRW